MLSIPRSENVDGVRTGSLSSNEEAAAIVALIDATEREPSPTMLLARTLTVYVPEATLVNSAGVDVVVTLAMSVPAALIK